MVSYLHICRVFSYYPYVYYTFPGCSCCCLALDMVNAFGLQDTFFLLKIVLWFWRPLWLSGFGLFFRDTLILCLLCLVSFLCFHLTLLLCILEELFKFILQLPIGFSAISTLLFPAFHVTLLWYFSLAYNLPLSYSSPFYLLVVFLLIASYLSLGILLLFQRGHTFGCSIEVWYFLETLRWWALSHVLQFVFIRPVANRTKCLPIFKVCGLLVYTLCILGHVLNPLSISISGICQVDRPSGLSYIPRVWQVSASLLYWHLLPPESTLLHQAEPAGHKNTCKLQPSWPGGFSLLCPSSCLCFAGGSAQLPVPWTQLLDSLLLNL